MTKLTKRFVEAVEPQSKGHVVWDDEFPGFGLRVYASASIFSPPAMSSEK